MFEGALEDRFSVLVAAEVNLRTRRDADAELLQLALCWADLHADASLPKPADVIEERRRRLADQVGIRMGGEGTPLVLGSCPAELAAVLETMATGARHLIADALDLRDRVPRLWMTVQDGRVAAWKARRVAAATRPLTTGQVAEVDAVVHEVIATLGWARFEAILNATIKQADPEGARAAEQQAANQRFVAVGRANDHHIRTLIARGTSLDILSFLAAVNRIADLLRVEGDQDPLEIRRSTAVGVLARPAYALELLARHQTSECSPSTDEQAEPDPESDGYLSLPSRSPLLQDGHRCGCGPRLNLHVHLTDIALTAMDSQSLCRIEGIGPVTAPTVRKWLGRSDVSVTVRPIVVPDPPPVDSYEIPQAIRNALAARHPVSIYPWSSATRQSMDLDHTVAYVPLEKGGPRGQTGPHNLGPLSRREHRHKTFGHLTVRQPAAGVYLWRSRHGWVWLVTNAGTHPLGNTPAAQALWRAAATQPEPVRRLTKPNTRTPRRFGTRIDTIRPVIRPELILRS